MNALTRLFWLFSILTIAHFAYIHIFIMPGILADSGGIPPLDTAITGYTAAEAKAFFLAIEASGNTSFAAFHAFDDRVFPILYGTALALAVWLLADGWSKPVRIILAITPLLATAVDYLENAKIVAMLKMDAAQIPESLADAANSMTTTKYTLIGISIGIIVAILVKKLVAGSARQTGPDNEKL